MDALSRQRIELGMSLQRAARFDEAEALYQQALQQNPRNPGILLLIGLLNHQAGRSEAAVAWILRAIAEDGSIPEFHFNLGVVARAAGQLDRAIAAFRKALALRPDYVEAMGNLSVLLMQSGQFQEALNTARQLTARWPQAVEGWVNLGHALLESMQAAQAVEAYRKALSLDPQRPGVHASLAMALSRLGRLDDAIAMAQEGARLHPENADARNGLGMLLQQQGRITEGVAELRAAVALSPQSPALHSNLLYGLWFDPRAHADPAGLYGEHRRWAQRHGAAPASIPPHANSPDPDRRLRIGYISGGLRDNTVGLFMEGVLAHHDKSAFEILCYAEVPQEDSMTPRLRQHARTWRTTCGIGDDQLARIIREDQIDILVDLGGHIGNNRLPVLARKPAPVQATYLWQPTTTGLDQVDYLITDPHLHPPGTTEQYHSERIIRLPECYSCLLSRPQEPSVSPLPALRRGYVTFVSTSVMDKINQDVMKTWARVLEAVPNSRLIARVLGGKAGNRSFRARLESAGIPGGRLELVPRAESARFLELYRDVDIALDAFPYTGYTNTHDALWMGVPVVSLSGLLPVSRLALSVLAQVGLEELVAQTPDRYVEIASGLASDLPRLADLRAALRQRMRQSPLMNCADFTRKLEQLYRRMWQDWCAGPSAR